MIEYDRKILQEMADLLYEEAERVQVMSALKYGIGIGAVGAIVGSYMGSTVSMYTNSGGSNKAVLGFLIGAAVGAFLGWLNASVRALLLKVEAQKLICQAEIEANTRLAKSA